MSLMLALKIGLEIVAIHPDPGKLHAQRLAASGTVKSNQKYRKQPHAK